MDALVVTGRTEAHLCDAARAGALGAFMHRDVVEPFLRLREAGREQGFELAIDSGFRSFERQLSIWNRKARGELKVLDGDAVPLDITTLTGRELVLAILRWSALPGASRHHWGTELDVFDAAAKPEGYVVELIPDEVNPGGMFGPLHAWLDQRMAEGTAFGFFRPYDRDRGGVAPERWHLSCAPVASPLEAGLTADVLRATLAAAELELKHTVLEMLDDIHERFVINVGRPPS